jgi:hypothetical protein
MQQDPHASTPGAASGTGLPQHDELDVVEVGPTQDLTDRPAGRGRKGLLVGAGLLTVALVGGGAAVAASQLGGGGAQPDEVVPASALAFVSVDLRPGVRQSLELLRFARKFPDAAARLRGGDDPRKALFTALRENGGLSGDWASDVQPWLGQRAGLAVLPPAAAGQDPDPVVVLAVTDPGRARAGLAKVTDGEAACRVTDDFAVCADDAAVAARAVQQAARASLADDQTYTADLDQVGADGVARAWVDVARVAKSLSEDDRTQLLGAVGGQPGRAAMSLRFDGGAAQLDGSVTGVRGPAIEGTASVADLPADTVAALGVAGADDLVRYLWTQVRTMASGTGSSAEGLDQQAEELGQQLGLKLPDDVAAALGDRVSVALGRGTDGGTPRVAVRVSGSDAAVRKVTRAVEQATGTSLTTARAAGGGTGTVLASSQRYAAAVAAGSGARLGGTQAFRDAAPGAAQAQSVLFVDMAGLLDRSSDPLGIEDPSRRLLQPVAAVGVTGRQDGSTARFTARLTTR